MKAKLEVLCFNLEGSAIYVVNSSFTLCCIVRRNVIYQPCFTKV